MQALIAKLEANAVWINQKRDKINDTPASMIKEKKNVLSTFYIQKSADNNLREDQISPLKRVYDNRDLNETEGGQALIDDKDADWDGTKSKKAHKGKKSDDDDEEDDESDDEQEAENDDDDDDMKLEGTNGQDDDDDDDDELGGDDNADDVVQEFVLSDSDNDEN